jgi:hypothetical protein
MPTKNDDFLEVLNLTEFTNRDVVFLFSELRKLIEVSSKDRKTLKFYCDWILHPKKDRVHPEMKSYIKDVYENAVSHIMQPMMYEYSKKISELIYFEVLRSDLEAELCENNLPTNIVNGDTWLNLVSVLVKLLERQPLVNPIPEVEYIEFLPSAEGASILVIKFTKLVTDRQGKDNHFYRIGNFY